MKFFREKNEALIKIHGMCPDRFIPDELIGECSISIKEPEKHYFLASIYDKKNEMRPQIE